MSDFKEVVELVKRLPWFVALGRHYKDEDALEIVRFAKIKQFDYDKPVLRPGDLDSNYYFILRGKVAIGSLSFNSIQNFFVTLQSSVVGQVTQQR